MRTMLALVSVASFSFIVPDAVRADSPHQLAHQLKAQADCVVRETGAIMRFVPQAHSMYDTALAISSRADQLCTPYGVDPAQLQAICGLFGSLKQQAEYWEHASDDWDNRRHFTCSVSGARLRGDDLEERFDDIYDHVDDMDDLLEDLRDSVPSGHAHHGQWGIPQGQQHQSYYGGQQFGHGQQYGQPNFSNNGFQYNNGPYAKAPQQQVDWMKYLHMFLNARR